MNIKIEDILDRCIAEVKMGKTPDEALQQYPEAADDIRPLLAVACELQKLPTPSTSASGLIRTMAKLSVQQTEATAQRRKTTLFSRPVLIRAVAVILIVFIAGWTTVTSSAQTLPGDLLYPLKLFTERVRFLLTINYEDKAELRIVFSEERLKELIKKHGKGKGIDKTLLYAMLDEAKMALDAGAKLPEVSRGLLISRVANLSEFQEKTLEQLKNHASPIEQEELMPFMDMCQRRCNWMREMMGDTDSGPMGPPAKMMQQWMKMCPMWQQNDNTNNCQ
jgi:hypothetical protein